MLVAFSMILELLKILFMFIFQYIKELSSFTSFGFLQNYALDKCCLYHKIAILIRGRGVIEGKIYKKRLTESML